MRTIYWWSIITIFSVRVVRSRNNYECHEVLLRMATTISCTLKETGRKSSFSMLVATAITRSILLVISEVADNNCVYRNVVHHSAGEFMQLLPVVAADPTLPRTKSVRCAVCDHPEAVFFQAMSRSEEGMILFFVCCNPNCGYRWRD
ncbi:hypothetical protein ZIOFF_046500 [Zingiber officinale]|uniref:TFIIS-type domain-containing protein n=1 Tax=Zingiber officinale TaxID=94328 RepID=A0A8J5KUS8_ZINOF|nr:hypothetical protein ZIOFF_046500 [Zingiber officinale]